MTRNTNDMDIADEQEVLRCMTAIMRSGTASTAEKLRAAEKLGTLLGLGGRSVRASAEDVAAQQSLDRLLRAQEADDDANDR